MFRFLNLLNMNIGFIIGHSSKSKGIKSEYFNKFEFDFWKGFQCELEKLGKVFYHEYNRKGYTARQKAMARQTKQYNFDFVFELHFNGSESNAAGCEAWFYDDNLITEKVALRFCKKYTSLSSTRNRGAKELYNRKQRGYGFVKEQFANAILLEPFFGDNPKDCEAFSINNFVESIKYAINEK